MFPELVQLFLLQYSVFRVVKSFAQVVRNDFYRRNWYSKYAALLHAKMCIVKVLSHKATH